MDVIMVLMVWQIAQKLHPVQPTAEHALSLLVSANILPFASQREADPATVGVYSGEVREIFRKYKRTFQEVCLGGGLAVI